jgi:hypothetical protein
MAMSRRSTRSLVTSTPYEVVSGKLMAWSHTVSIGWHRPAYGMLSEALGREQTALLERGEVHIGIRPPWIASSSLATRLILATALPF